MTVRVLVQAADFDPGAAIDALGALGGGAVASFVGLVRGGGTPALVALTIEHYPGMTERALTATADRAMQRFGLLGCTIIHRVGRLRPGEPIVLAAAAAGHRGAALAGVEALVDWLKTEAPLWKQESFADGSRHWVEARPADAAAAARW